MAVISTFSLNREFWTNLTNCAYKLDKGSYMHIFLKLRYSD